MKLTNEQLKTIYFGAYSFMETEDGYNTNVGDDIMLKMYKIHKNGGKKL